MSALASLKRLLSRFLALRASRGERARPGLAAPPSAGTGSRGRVICVTSGKGGTGKSVIATNLAVYAARHGLRVLLLDADLGLANAHLLLSISPAFNLSHVLSGHKRIEEIAETGPFGLKLVSGGSGVSELAALDEFQLQTIVREIARIRESFDVVVVDTSAGIAPQTMAFLYAADEVLLVTTPDVTAMTDAYAIVKTVHRHSLRTDLRLVVNKAHSPEEAHAVHERVSRVAEKFLGRKVGLLGFVLFDRCVGRSIVVKDPVIHSFPRSPAAKGIGWIAQRVIPGGKLADGTSNSGDRAAAPRGPASRPAPRDRVRGAPSSASRSAPGPRGQLLRK